MGNPQKEFFTRIQHKHDTEANWNKATNFIPLQGEIIIYDEDSSHDYNRVKIGDGTTTVINLPFIVDIPNIVANGLPYCLCHTTADTAAKYAYVVSGKFNLFTGATVIVKFTNANSAASPTLNINDTGAKPIYRYGTTAASTGTTTTGWVAGAVQMFTYDGTGWVRDYWNNTTYSNASLGQGYTTCSTAAATVAKTASLSSYALTTGGIVSVKFTNAVPANATLNISSKGSKAIYYRGAKITAGVIEAGDTATFIYNGSQYHLIAIDGGKIPENLLTINLTNSNGGTAVGINADTLDGKHASDFITKTNITNENGSVELVNNADTFGMKKVDDFMLKEDTLEATQVTLSSNKTIEEAFAQCWFEFVDEEGNPTDEPFVHWMIDSETGKPVTFQGLPAAEDGEF